MGAVVYSYTETMASFGACWQCGITFAGPTALVQNRREDGKSFFCPNGHSAAFVDSEVKKLQKQLDESNARTQAALDRANRERAMREMADRRTAAVRGEVTKFKNRVGNGVCPCCNRTFQNLMRHMGTKHPGYKLPDADPVTP